MGCRDDIVAIDYVSGFVQLLRVLVVQRRLNKDYWLLDKICRCLAVSGQHVCIFNTDTIHDCIQLKLGHLFTTIMSLPKISRSCTRNMICGSSEPLSGATGGEFESSCESGDILGGATVESVHICKWHVSTDGAVCWPGYSGS